MYKKHFVLFILIFLLSLAFGSCGGGGGSSDSTGNDPDDSEVAAQWAKTVTSGSNGSSFESVAVDSSGNIYATGYIYGTDTFNFGNSVTAAGTYSGYNILLVKYNPSGVAQWAKTVTSGSDQSYFCSVAVDSNDNVYAVGYIYGTGIFNFGNNVTAAGPNSYSNSNILLVKYNSSGAAQWAKTVTSGSSSSSFYSVAVDSNDNVYAVGYICGSDEFNFGNSVTATGTSDTFNILLVKYNSSGVEQWAKTVISGSDESDFFSVAADSSGNIYAAGWICGSGEFNFGNSVTAAGSTSYNLKNILLVKYNSSGVPQWAKTVTSGSSSSSFYSVAVDSGDNIYTAGGIYGTGTFSFGSDVTTTGTYKNGSNCLLVKYNSSGVAQWARTVTSVSTSSFFSVTVDSSDDVYATGSGGIIKYNSSGVEQWAKTRGFGSVAVDSSGNIYAAGVIYGTSTFSFGNDITATGSYSGNNILLVKYE